MHEEIATVIHGILKGFLERCLFQFHTENQAVMRVLGSAIKAKQTRPLMFGCFKKGMLIKFVIDNFGCN